LVVRSFVPPITILDGVLITIQRVRQHIRQPLPAQKVIYDLTPEGTPPSIGGSGLSADVEDYVVAGHAGHGTNSYAISDFLVYRPLAVFLQLPWGGVCMGDARREAEAQHRRRVAYDGGRYGRSGSTHS
jgi:hypothetical protein